MSKYPIITVVEFRPKRCLKETYAYIAKKPSTPRTYNLKPGMTRWRTKLVLDFAYLLSYCESLSKFFLLLEDDVVPEENFVAKTMEFIEGNSGEHWVSLSVSEFLSIGRIYADATLPKLVSFMLTSYLTQVRSRWAVGY